LLCGRGIAQRLLGAGEQAQRFNEPGVGVDDGFELVVRDAKTAGLQQCADAPHGVDESGSIHVRGG
jgi:hypothetical protein